MSTPNIQRQSTKRSRGSGISKEVQSGLTDDTPDASENSIDEDLSAESEVPVLTNQEPPKKRAREYIEFKGGMEYWKTFKKYKDENDKVRAECIYCLKTYAAHSNAIGCKNIKKHWETCAENPENKTKGTQSKIILEKVDESGQGKMRNWVLNQNDVRTSLAKMIIMDEMPFRSVERPSLKLLLRTVSPTFKVPSRCTVERDCYALYLSEKVMLKAFVKLSCQSVCITTDSWTSIQKIKYMCVTAHFIDNDWGLQKIFLNFCPIVGHKGEDIARGIDDCLRPWGSADKVFTITVDNVSSNDSAVTAFKDLIRSNGSCINNANHMHMRCVAHIANLIVSDGLKLQVKCIDKVRDYVKYWRGSPSRISWFEEQAVKLRVETHCSLILDCPTRWNSTYDMLQVAFKYKAVFSRLDPPKNAKGESIGEITPADWKKVGVLVTFLKEFFDFTKDVSASSYVTVNNVFFYIGNIVTALDTWIVSEDLDCQSMALEMKGKCNKYWDDIEKMNMMIFVAIILDPTYKFAMVEMGLQDLYGNTKGNELAKKVKVFAVGLFEEYRRKYSRPVSRHDQAIEETSLARQREKPTSKFLNNLNQKRKQLDDSDIGVTEFDQYLTELRSSEDQNQILVWWKKHEVRFPILARMARDVLAIPISTVPSESAFSTGGRTLDKFRSRLTPKTVQGLICTQDWLLANLSSSVDDEGDSTTMLVKMEEDVEKDIPSSVLSLADKEPIYF